MELRLSEYDIRRQKVQTLRDLGISPYAQHFDKQHTISSLSEDSVIARRDDEAIHFRSIEEILQGPQNTISTAGRLMLKRVSGKLTFGQIMDETGTIQIMREHQSSKLIASSGEGTTKDPGQQKNNGKFDGLDSSLRSEGQNYDQARSEFLGESSKSFDYFFVDKLLDVGDFVGIRGELFITHKGERTIFVSEYQLLSKAIRPLGDKFHGIGDDQERSYRQRYLDMIFNQETINRMKFRSHFIRTLREFYRRNNFLEIECPVLTPSASGAAAKPFSTYHNDFDREFYLRICNETELKKATIGGLEKVFTIATNFRNEGSDPSHLQEFTMLEHQNVYKSFHEDMDFTQKMFDYIFDSLQLNRTFTVKDKVGNSKEVDFTSPRPKIDYVEGVNTASGLDITNYTIDDADRLRADIKAKGIEFEGMEQMGTMTLIDYLYKKVLRPTLTGPLFVYNYPRIIAPLARVSDEDPNKCEKRQVVVNGREIINSYGELVDPQIQKSNFDEQSKAEDSGDSEATSADLEFVKAMEYGMPIQAGFGMGIDRIIALITQQDNLRDVVMFPLMKPENHNEGASLDKTMGSNNSYNIPKQTIIRSYDEISDDIVQQAENLAKQYATDTIGHLKQVGGLMKFFAQKLGEDRNYRYIVGLLHDIDRDHIGKDGDKHLQEDFVHIIDSLNISSEIKNDLITDIRSHYTDGTGIKPSTLVQYYLSSIDELSGLMYAYARMRGGSFENMEVSSVIKRVKDKKFAAGVDREHVRNCEKYLHKTLEEFIGEMIIAFQSL